MNITDIQLELRKIEEQLKALEVELEEFKPDKNKINESQLKEIERLAKKIPIKNKAIKAADESVKKYYIQFLSMLAYNDGKKVEDKLLFICRVAYGADYNLSASEIKLLGADTNQNTPGDIIDQVGKYYMWLITDALIVASLGGTPSEDNIKLITTVASTMGCSREDMKIISTVVTCVLKNNFDPLDKLEINSGKYLGIFTRYLPEEWLIKRRAAVPFDKEKQVATAVYVKNGDAIISEQNIYRFHKIEKYDMSHYYDKELVSGRIYEKAPSDGIVLIDYSESKYSYADYVQRGGKHDMLNIFNQKREKKDKYYIVNYFYIVSCFDDEEDVIKYFGGKK